jgi:hypothetical protein
MSEEDFREKKTKKEHGGFHSPMEVVNVSSLPDETSCRGAEGAASKKKMLTRWLWENRIFGPQG